MGGQEVQQRPIHLQHGFVTISEHLCAGALLAMWFTACNVHSSASLSQQLPDTALPLSDVDSLHLSRFSRSPPHHSQMLCQAVIVYHIAVLTNDADVPECSAIDDQFNDVLTVACVFIFAASQIGGSSFVETGQMIAKAQQAPHTIPSNSSASCLMPFPQLCYWWRCTLRC